MNSWVTILKKLCVLAAAGSLLGHAGAGYSFAQDKAVTSDVRIPIDRKVSVPCLSEGILLDGHIRAQFRVKFDEGGSYVEADFSFEDVTGTGTTGGNRYQANGTNHFDSSGQSLQEFSFISNFALNKPKSDESLMAHVKLRIRLGKKGEVTAEVRDVDIDCGT